MTSSQQRQLSKLIRSHKSTHVIHATQVNNIYVIKIMETVKTYDLSLQGFESYLFVLGELPQPWSDPPIVRMARLPKTPGE